jgi:hypothetical protein
MHFYFGRFYCVAVRNARLKTEEEAKKKFEEEGRKNAKEAA